MNWLRNPRDFLPTFRRALFTMATIPATTGQAADVPATPTNIHTRDKGSYSTSSSGGKHTNEFSVVGNAVGVG